MLREASRVHTFVSFPVAGVLTRISIVGEAGHQVNEEPEVLRGVLGSKRWGRPCQARSWRVRGEDVDPSAVGALEACGMPTWP